MSTKIPLDTPDPVSRYEGVTVLMEAFVTRLLNSSVGEEVQERLTKGYSIEAVAEFVHDQGELQDCSRPTVCRILTTMRDHMTPIEKAQAMPTTVRRAVEMVDHGLDVLAELRELYEMQRRRIEIDFRLEVAGKKLLPTTHREVKVAVDLLSKYAQVQMDFGLVKRQLGTLEVEEGESKAIPGCSSKVNVALADPRRRQRLLGVLHRLTALEDKSVEENTIDVSPDVEAD